MANVKRLHYFNGEFLKQQDFTDEQHYHLSMRRWHNQHCHTAGIAYGMELTAGNNQVTVAPGMAIDIKGRELVLLDPLDITVSAPVKIAVKYQENESDSSDDTGVTGNKRWTESVISTDDTDPDAVVLGEVTSTGSPVTLNASFSRIYTAPRIRGNLTVDGNLTVMGDSVTQNVERIEGNTILGNAASDTVTIAGRLKSSNPSHALEIQDNTHITGSLQISSGNLTLARHPTDAMHATTKQYVDTNLVTRSGDTMTGHLTLPANGLSVGGTQLVAAGGHVGVGASTSAFTLTIGSNSGDNAVHIASNHGLHGDRRLNLLRFGTDGDYQLLHDNAGIFGVNTLALHAHDNDALGFYSSGWLPLFVVKGKTGDSYLRGRLGITTVPAVAKLDIESPWANWLFLKQQRATGGGGGFIFHNPWKDTDNADRNSLVIAYQTPAGAVDWSHGFAINGPTGDVTIGGEIAQEGWHNLGLVNGWKRYSTEYNPAQYFKDKNGVVHLRGLIKKDGTAVNTSGLLATLPTGYRPSNRELQVVCTNSNVSGRCDVLADGRVWVVLGNTGWFSLDGITFRAV